MAEQPNGNGNGNGNGNVWWKSLIGIVGGAVTGAAMTITGVNSRIDQQQATISKLEVKMEAIDRQLDRIETAVEKGRRP